MKNIFKYPVLLVFGSIIIFFAVGDLVTPDKKFSEMENKELAGKPEFSLSAIMDSSKTGFAQKYEKYTNEQFLLRDTWITIKSLCETALLKIENNGILYGKDGYMFDKFVSYDEERFSKNLSSLKEFGENTKNISKTLMIAPSAYEVLSDKMPIGSHNVSQEEILNKIKDELAGSNFYYLDLLNVLTNEYNNHNENKLYYKTDHHWTTLGAYKAYEAFCLEKGLTPVPYDVETASSDFYGTHFSKCKKAGTKGEVIEFYEPSGDLTVLVNGEKKEGLYDKEKLSTRDKYAFFLWGNNGITEIQNENAEEDKTLMVIKDSYANSLVPFLSENYKKVVVIDLRFLVPDLSSVIKEQNPHEIIINYNAKNVLTDPDIPRIKY